MFKMALSGPISDDEIKLTVTSFTATITHFQQRLKAAHEEIHSVRAAAESHEVNLLAEIGGYHQRAASGERELHELRQKVTELKADLHLKTTTLGTVMRFQVDSVEYTTQKIEQATQELRKNISDAQSECDDLKEECNQLRAENLALCNWFMGVESDSTTSRPGSPQSRHDEDNNASIHWPSHDTTDTSDRRPLSPCSSEYSCRSPTYGEPGEPELPDSVLFPDLKTSLPMSAAPAMAETPAPAFGLPSTYPYSPPQSDARAEPIWYPSSPIGSAYRHVPYGGWPIPPSPPLRSTRMPALAAAPEGSGPLTPLVRPAPVDFTYAEWRLEESDQAEIGTKRPLTQDEGGSETERGDRTPTKRPRIA